MSWLASPEIWAALLTLTALEIVLGIDNIIFISILAGKLPQEKQKKVRLVGLAAAMLTRIVLLFSLSWLMGLTQPLFTVLGHAISGRDLILIVGGLFLLGKATLEIHNKLEMKEKEGSVKSYPSVAGTVVQIMILDIVFSLDSVITAVGMANQLWIMVTAVVVAVGFMMLASGAVSRFIEQHPTVKLLALSFLLLIGFVLVGEGLGQHIAKGYIYFAMFFSFFVEMLNIRFRKKQSRLSK
ncbi:MAG TPA: TerC family protein [Candidatus Obscuribacterales bacterium]